MFKIFNFTNHRLGDKLVACYQLQYYATNEGIKYLIFDTSADSLFPVKDFFPDLGEFSVENPHPEQLWEELLNKGFETLHFGNLWISSPSLKQDTNFRAKMILPFYLKNLQQNFYDENKKRVVDYKIKIVNHCLLDAGYNIGRNHNREQFDRLIGRVREYIKQNNIDAVVVDIPIDYSWNVPQIMSLIELGDIFIGGDTGFSHTFALFNPDRPLIAIYGDDTSDRNAFEEEKIRMKCSHSWCSDPMSENLKKFVMNHNLFDDDKVFNEIINQINILNGK